MIKKLLCASCFAFGLSGGVAFAEDSKHQTEEIQRIEIPVVSGTDNFVKLLTTTCSLSDRVDRAERALDQATKTNESREKELKEAKPTNKKAATKAASSAEADLATARTANDLTMPAARALDTARSKAGLMEACRKLDVGAPFGEADWDALRSLRDGRAEFAREFRELKDVRLSGAASVADPFRSAESALINGLAELIVDRAKAEAALYLRAHVAKVLCGQDDSDAKATEEQEYARALFPETCDVLRNLDPELALYAIGTTLRQAARTDLEVFPDTAFALAATKYPTNTAEFEAMRFAYAGALATAAGRSPLSVARGLHMVAPRECETNKTCDGEIGSLRAASATLDTILRLDLHNSVEPQSFNSAAFVVFLEWRLKEARVLTNELPVASMNELRKLASDGGQMVADLVKLGEEVKSAEDPASRRQRLGLAAASLIESTATLASDIPPQLLSPSWKGDAAQFAKVLKAIRNTAKFAKAAINEDYPAAAALGVAFLQEHITDNCASANPKWSPKACGSAMVVAKTVPLIVEVATAQSGKEVAATLEAAVAPLGSYRSKYQRDTITLGAMLGASFGGEYLPRQDVEETRSGTLGVFAPVGLHLARPVGTKSHLGLFFSVLDLGTLASFRFDNELKPTSETKTAEAATEPNVSFEQVFSPGVFVVFGACKSPFVFGGGISVAPALRDVTFVDSVGGATTTSESAALRGQIFAAVDVPLFGF